MYQTRNYEIKGLVPTLFHSARTANPLDTIGREIKRFTSKRKKTDEDIYSIQHLEWLASFYFETEGALSVKQNDIAISGFGRPIWPTKNIKRMLVDSATKSRMGKSFKSAIMIEEDAPLIYDGPKTIDELFKNQKFYDVQSAKIKTSTVIRTRPIFRQWGLKFAVSFMPDIVDPNFLDETVELAGKMIGLSDYRPEYGRFRLESAS